MGFVRVASVMACLTGAVTLLAPSAPAANGRNEGAPFARAAEAYRLGQIGLVRRHREDVDACIDGEAKRLSGLDGEAAIVARQVFERCTPELRTYAVSLLALAPAPDYTQAAPLVRGWQSAYADDIAARLDALRAAPLPARPETAL